MTAPLAELDDLAAQMQVDVADVDPDTGDLLLAEASAMVRSYCRWDIAPAATTTITLDSDGGTLLRLPCLHVTAVTTVTLDDGTAITDFAWSDDGLLARTQPQHGFGCFGPPLQRWPLGFRRVTVTYQGGYATTPAEVKAIVLLLAARAFMNPQGVLSETIGGYTYTYNRGTGAFGTSGSVGTITLNGNEMRILDRYRIPNLA